MLVLGRGLSINEYPRNELKRCAKRNFTFGVNDAAFDFSVDMVVAGDYQWILDNQVKLEKLGRPIITREWEVLRKTKLDLIMLPNSIVNYARLSGQIAVKIADSFAGQMRSASFVLGIDHTSRHYDRVETNQQPIHDVTPLDSYARLNCCHTVNLGAASEITCWPKILSLPENDKPSALDKRSGELFIRMNADKLFFWRLK